MGVRVIRWVGHPSPLYDHNIYTRIKSGQMPAPLALQFEQFEHLRRVTVRRGQSVFRLRTHHGYTRDYKWGPTHFDVEMDERDWRRLARHAIDRYMFLDVTNGPPPFRPLLKPAEWMELLKSAQETPAPATILPPGKW